MTFYEAALKVLESAGNPLHVNDITQQSVQQNLLSHVGKTPEQTMLSRLAAMARRPRDRRVIVTGNDTFALTEWQLPEDTAALAAMAAPEVNLEETQPALRPTERHPEPRTENVRASGRGADRKRHRDEERGRKRRFPPIPEVVFEILSEADSGLKPEEIAVRARSRELAGDELSNEQILTALLEDNQRRIDAGRRPQFVLEKETGAIQLERAGSPSEPPPLDLQAAFAAALGIPLQDGRPVLPRRSEGTPLDAGQDVGTALVVRQAVKDGRRAVARTLRRRLSELESGTFEKSCVHMLHTLGFREIKVAKRAKDGPLVTARRRDGSVEMRYAVRMIRGNPPVDRRSVQELRKDLGHYSAHVGLLLTPGDPRGDARSEATSGGGLVFLWCGDALADKFLEAHTGVSVETVEMFEIDERFFETARAEAQDALRRREELHREKERRAQAGGPPLPAPNVEAAAADSASVPASDLPVALDAPVPPQDDSDDEEDGEGEEDRDEDLAEASAFVEGSPSEANAGGPQEPGRRRRRRRRGRRGRGPRDGAPGAPGSPSVPGAEAAQAPVAGGGAESSAPPVPNGGTPV